MAAVGKEKYSPLEFLNPVSRFAVVPNVARPYDVRARGYHDR
ncbi:uncharacterized protein FIBRA_09398 [Fibroporia radiculosa]|uniref:Uncharacterized protein n=1 Tax=Fibroporia radiculosa TaxID=599839 RepID=J7S6F0_9APHY|nr:uncharacterized protein FIBRA_09398 [Fibroporia radiculosa]CCM07074.1 predicted protein [Fibroporia radiculosa]